MRRGEGRSAGNAWMLALALAPLLLLVILGRPSGLNSRAGEAMDSDRESQGETSDVGGEHGEATAREMAPQTTDAVETRRQDPADSIEYEAFQDDDATSVRMEQTLERVAHDALYAYQAQRNCVLLHAGYVDLTGNAWACLVQGDGWVELKLVRRSDDDASRVLTVRLDVNEWSRVFARLGLGEDS